MVDTVEDAYVLTERGEHLLEEINYIEKLAKAFGIRI
ncbi:hypothetical protein HRbin02_01815 [Candidatus Calditenuaceae archaeon HR02]|nr:hypothetical protein HRbin02_01815 [Candidatus Calditenuaceae archaeon HR02]